MHQYGVLALGTGRQQGHRAAHQLLDATDIFDRLRRQLAPGARPRGLGLPPLHGLVDRLDLGLGVLASGQVIDLTAVEAIAHAHFQLVQAVQDVELGQRQAVDSTGPYGLPHEHGIEPAAAPRASGHGAELAALLADALPEPFGPLGWEWPLPDPGRVGLADAEHVADRGRSEAGAGGGLRGHGIGGGHVRIRAVIDVEQGALRAFEQNALALAPLLVEQRPHRVDIRQHARRDFLKLPLHGIDADLRHAQPAAQRVVVRQQPLDLAPERARVGKVHDTDRAPTHLVLVGRADAATRGAHAGQCTAGFTNGVELLVQWQDQGRVLGDTQALRRDLDPLLLEPVNFLDQRVHTCLLYTSRCV